MIVWLPKLHPASGLRFLDQPAILIAARSYSQWLRNASLNIAERIYDDNHRETAIFLGNLAVTYCALGGMRRHRSRYCWTVPWQGEVAGPSVSAESGLHEVGSSPLRSMPLQFRNDLSLHQALSGIRVLVCLPETILR
jgi:hypothetical protein